MSGWRANGGYLGPRPTGPSTSAASGWWDSRSQFRNKRDGQWPTVGDPYWDSVVLLLQDSLEDESSRNQAVTVSGDAAISTAQVKVGTHSLAFDNSGDRLTLPAGSDFAFGTGDYTVETWIYILPHSTTNQVRVLSTSNSSSNFSFEVMSAGTLRMWTGSNLLNFGGNVTRESWHHVAFCRSGGTVRAFVDGLIVGGPVSNSTNMINNQSVQTPSTNAYPCPACYLDSFRITKGIARYTANFTTPSAPHPIG